ncbi:LysR family transcriptional regulator [Pseudochelatococcus sp. B33]
MITTRQLRYFWQIAQSGSVTEAARVLRVAQPAVSLQIKGLEDTLGLRLLERTAHGSRLTPAGEIFLEGVSDILQRMRALEQQMRGLAGSSEGVIRLGLPPSIVYLLSSDTIDRLNNHSGGHVTIVEALSAALLPQLQAGELDAALIFEVPPQRSGTRVPILQESLYLIERSEQPLDNPFAGDATVDIYRALGGEMAFYSHSDTIWRLVNAVAARLSIPVRMAYEVSSQQAILRLIESGLAATIMPYGLMAHMQTTRHIRASRIDDPRLFRVLYYLTPDTPARPGLPAYIEHILADYRRKLPYHRSLEDH